MHPLEWGGAGGGTSSLQSLGGAAGELGSVLHVQVTWCLKGDGTGGENNVPTRLSGKAVL